MTIHRLRNQKGPTPQFEPTVHPSSTVGPWSRVHALQPGHQAHTCLLLIAAREPSHLGGLGKRVLQRTNDGVWVWWGDLRGL